MDMLAGFQFEDGQAPRARDGQHVNDAVLRATAGKYLRINKARIEHRVNARYVLAYDGFEPALRLRAIQRVARVGGQWMAMVLQVEQQALHGGLNCGTRLGQQGFALAVRNEPGVQISGTARIDFFKNLARGIMLVQFDFRAVGKTRQPMRNEAAQIYGTIRRSASIATQIGIAQPVEPQQSKCEAVVYGVLRFAIGNGEESDASGAAPEPQRT